MPQPTKEQFDAAAHKVMQSAPAGLSREQFFALVDKELGAYQTDEGTREATTRAIARSSGGIIPPHAVKDELGNDLNASPGLLRNFFANTVRNPGLQGAAHPTSTADLLPLVVPSTTGAGELGGRNLLKGYKRVVEGGARDAASGSAVTSPFRFVRGAARELGANSMLSPVSAHDTELAGTIGKTPTPTQGVTVMSKTRDPLDAMMATRKQPVRPTGIIRQGQTQNTLDTRIAGEQGQFSNTAMTSDQIKSILDELRQGEGAETSTTLPPEPTTTAAGSFKQSGKFPKSGQKGQAGGYSSGRPSISAQDHDSLLQKFGGRPTAEPGVAQPVQTPVHTSPARDYFRDIEPTTEDWHSGAEPGSPEARRAQSTHTYEREMNQGYRRRTNDPLASLLGALLGGGSAGALMSSHGEEQ